MSVSVGGGGGGREPDIKMRRQNRNERNQKPRMKPAMCGHLPWFQAEGPQRLSQQCPAVFESRHV